MGYAWAYVEDGKCLCQTETARRMSELPARLTKNNILMKGSYAIQYLRRCYLRLRKTGFNLTMLADCSWMI